MHVFEVLKPAQNKGLRHEIAEKWFVCGYVFMQQVMMSQFAFLIRHHVAI